jgi:hypothetical protein
MAKVKELERKRILLAADNFLSDQEDGDNYDAYLKLLEESEKGNDDCCAADYVTVWQPLEHMTVAKMIETIENAVIFPEMPEALKGIDWDLLKTQKKVLLEMAENMDDVPKLEAVEGIICLLNEIQDAAVDEYGLDENLVFDLHPEDEEETPEEKPVSTRYKVWVEIERIETDKAGNETYHDEDFPIGLAYEDNIEDAVELQKIINDQYGRIS